MSTSQKILLVQLFSNGDCLYATAVARQIKTDYPGCHLTWAVAPACRSMIEGNPYVDAIEEVRTVARDDIAAFRAYKKLCLQRKAEGIFSEVFITHIADTNLAYYDGCIRSNILRAYDRPVTVPLQPVLRITETEQQRVAAFAAANHLAQYRYIILFEYAPQSGQSAITPAFALEVAAALAARADTAVILSSAKKMEHSNRRIIDGSVLSIRETAALTHYCTLLLGCSSGLTWISTSDAAKALPMVQLLSPYTVWFNPPSRDFARFGGSTDTLIELTDFTAGKVFDCIDMVRNEGFDAARKAFHQRVPLHFRTTERIVYNLLCYLQFKAIMTHIRVNHAVYGNKAAFNYAVGKAVVGFPFKLVGNFIRKKFLKN